MEQNALKALKKGLVTSVLVKVGKDGPATQNATKLSGEGVEKRQLVTQNGSQRPMQVLMLSLLHYVILTSSLNSGLYATLVIFLLLVIFFMVRRFREYSQFTGYLRDYTRTVIVEGTNFREFANIITGGSLPLPLQVVHVEMVMRDIQVMVQFSSLEAKKVMVPPMLECILEAKNATRGLQTLMVRIGGAVDRYEFFLAICQHLI